MPSLWSGSVTFGLVSIPVRLETSQTSRDVSFNLLHDECLQRIKQTYYCPTCDKYVERKDLVRGFEYEKDHFVVMEPEDFEKAEGEASRNIEIMAFVNRKQLHPAFLNRTYYLQPETGAEKGYLLLLRGMRETGSVALTRFVMRGKEYIGAVSADDGGLLLHILFHKGEYKRIEDVVEVPEVEVRDKELTLAKQIIENLTEDFDEEMLVDHYRERLMEIIRQKAEGEQVLVAETKQPAKVVDLMEALKRSLDLTAQKKPSAKVDVAEEIKPAERKASRKRA